MESYLHNADLDVTFWLQQLKELGLTLESLTNLGALKFLKLQKRARSEEEIEALAKFVESVTMGHKDKVEPSEPTNITGMSVSLYTPEAVIDYVREWHVEDDLTLEEIQDRLEYILKVKRNVISSSMDKNYWIKNYLLQTSLMKHILLFIEKLKPQPDEEIKGIKLIMREIMEQPELTEAIQIIPSADIISDFLYSSNASPEIITALDNLSDIPSFIQLLDIILQSRGSLAMTDVRLSDESIGNIVSKGILKLQSIYQQTYDDIFLMILVFPFQIKCTKNDVKLKPLSLQDVQKILNMFSEEIQNFNNKQTNPEMMQVYLLSLAAESPPLVANVLQMMKAIQPSVPDTIQNCTEKYLKGSSLVEFQKGLQLCIKNGIEKQKKKKGVNSVSAIQQQKLNSCKYKSNFMETADAHAVMHNLKLCKYYPKKMGLQEGLCIKLETLKLSLKEIPVTHTKQLPSIIMHKIMSYDCECRSDLLSEDKGDESSEGNIGGESNSKDSGIHPLDCLLAIFICSDDFLRQDLFSRLAKCQFAIPFILPDPFSGQLTIPLWAMRSIIKEWFISTDKKNVMQYTHPIVKYPMNILSFLRLGSQKYCKRSKSIILNKIISNGGHEHYFHYDLPGGQYERKLGGGLVDVCWYLPSGNPVDPFPEPLTFLNLHGDARQYLCQATILSQVSSVCFIVVNENIVELEDEMKSILNAMYTLPGGIVVLNAIEDEPQILKEEFPNIRVVSLSRNAAQINDAIRKQIREKIKIVKDLKSIEQLCDSLGTSVAIDESSDECQKGKLFAEKMKSVIQNHGDSKREDLLPLQGKNWKDWAAADKEFYRVTQRGKLSVNKYVEKVKKKKKDIRNEQVAHLESLTPLMDLFISFLTELKGSNNFRMRNYFLQFLKLELNYLSSQNISGKQYEYKMLRNQLLKLEDSHSKNQSEVKTDSSACKKKLMVLQKDIIESSFGLEHLLREIGQVYESAQISTKHSKHFSNLPKIAAELLIDGYPIELMDGDAAHVPLNWVLSVLQAAVDLLRNPNIFVFSVLGIQSTGKSTMLNTIFGLQFNVSAGRCTRGAFMQLLQLDEDLEKKTKCKYVLIVDTEGLRAPELDPLKMQKHDNELATFVIGLANMTLINIYGEVTGDMDDILQTSVHAFLRMSKVKIYPSCKFVHQNAGANINCEVGRAHLTEKLNKFTAAAAKEETKVNIKFFKDVITFNDQEDIHYFPGLWRGDPPMAPVNEGYSRAAQELKHQIVSIVLEKGDKRSLTLHEKVAGKLSLFEFRTRVNDLWQGLLKENFVFSFRNTLEISAYNALETAYNKWEWRFQEAMLQWEQKAENEISTEQLDSVSEKTNLKLIDLQDYLLLKYNAIKEEMDLYFEQRGDVFIQWKALFEKKMDILKDELKKHAEQHCKTLEESRRKISDFQKAQENSAKMITEKIQEHVERKREEQENLRESLQQKKLKPEQLRYLFERKLFHGNELSQYRDLKIITQKEVEQIEDVLKQYGGVCTENCLEHILVGDILQLDQIYKILKKTPQSESELQKKFDEIWSDLIQTVPPTIISRGSTIKDDVERALISHAGSKGEAQVYSMIKSKPLTDWKDTIDCERKNPSMIKSFVTGIASFGSAIGSSIGSLLHSSSHQPSSQPIHPSNEVLQATEELKRKVIDQVHKTLQELLKKSTDFKLAYTGNVLQTVDKVIDSSNRKKFLLLPEGYKYELYLTACSYALPKFKKMAELFQERNDPRLYLEKRVKGPLFIKFKNQYKQTEAEEGISDTLCAYLEEPIKVQVGKLLSVQLVTQMKDSDHSFSNKMALKKKVLLDLHHEDNFESYVAYLKNVGRYLEKKIKCYTIEFCDKIQDETGNTRLQAAAKNEASRLIRIIKHTVVSLEVADIQKWLEAFSDKVRGEIGEKIEPEDVLAGYDLLEEMNLDNLKRNIGIGLEKLKIKLHDSFNKINCANEMILWKNKPHDLLQNLIGCTAQCPFCGEQCDLLDPKHENDCDHRIEVHRISCLQGFRWRDTGVMTTHFCQVAVSRSDLSFQVSGDHYHPYNDYKSIHTKWEIPPDVSAEGSLYWKWFVGKYYASIAETFRAKPPDVPEEWRLIEWQEVEKNLNDLYNFRND